VDPTATETIPNDDTNLVILAVFTAIHHECETAIECPEIAFTSICRIASLARRAVRLGGPGLAKADTARAPAFATSA
jgi:hypothetical protein